MLHSVHYKHKGGLTPHPSTKGSLQASFGGWQSLKDLQCWVTPRWGNQVQSDPTDLPGISGRCFSVTLGNFTVFLSDILLGYPPIEKQRIIHNASMVDGNIHKTISMPALEPFSTAFLVSRLRLSLHYKNTGHPLHQHSHVIFPGFTHDFGCLIKVGEKAG